MSGVSSLLFALVSAFLPATGENNDQNRQPKVQTAKLLVVGMIMGTDLPDAMGEEIQREIVESAKKVLAPIVFAPAISGPTLTECRENQADCFQKWSSVTASEKMLLSDLRREGNVLSLSLWLVDLKNQKSQEMQLNQAPMLHPEALEIPLLVTNLLTGTVPIARFENTEKTFERENLPLEQPEGVKTRLPVQVAVQPKTLKRTTSASTANPTAQKVSVPLSPERIADRATAKTRAEYDARMDSRGAQWFFAGCCLSVFGFVLAKNMDAEPSPTRLIGQSPEYVEAYVAEYREARVRTRSKRTAVGCLVSGSITMLSLYLTAQ